MKTQITPLTPAERERLQEELGVKDLDVDPPGTDTLSIGELVDELHEAAREDAALDSN